MFTYLFCLPSSVCVRETYMVLHSIASLPVCASFLTPSCVCVCRRKSSWRERRTWQRPCTACLATPTSFPSRLPAPPPWITPPWGGSTPTRLSSPSVWPTPSTVSGKKVGVLSNLHSVPRPSPPCLPQHNARPPLVVQTSSSSSSSGCEPNLVSDCHRHFLPLLTAMHVVAGVTSCLLNPHSCVACLLVTSPTVPPSCLHSCNHGYALADVVNLLFLPHTSCPPVQYTACISICYSQY